MSNSEIISICQALKREGKQPSIALIKGRAAKGTPMPMLISGLQQWRTNPNAEVAPSDKKAELNTEDKTLEQRVKDLEQEVAYLKSLL